MKFRKARKIIRKAFRDEPDFKRNYVDNVAMCLFDALIDDESVTGYHAIDIRDKKTRDKIATKIIDLIFEK